MHSSSVVNARLLASQSNVSAVAKSISNRSFLFQRRGKHSSRHEAHGLDACTVVKYVNVGRRCFLEVLHKSSVARLRKRIAGGYDVFLTWNDAATSRGRNDAVGPSRPASFSLCLCDDLWPPGSSARRRASAAARRTFAEHWASSRRLRSALDAAVRLSSAARPHATNLRPPLNPGIDERARAAALADA